jgi:hypothetical protein
MITINSFGVEFKASFVTSAERIEYMKLEGIEILESVPYTNSEFITESDDFHSVTIKVTNITLLLLMHAGIRMGSDQQKKLNKNRTLCG